MERERRWLVISSDGRHATLGRATDPSPEQLESAAASIRDLGLSAWLVVSEGVYYGHGPIRLMMIRPLVEAAGPNSNWNEAEAAFLAAREIACS
jgi:hypothetical protein